MKRKGNENKIVDVLISCQLLKHRNVLFKNHLRKHIKNLNWYQEEYMVSDTKNLWDAKSHINTDRDLRNSNKIHFIKIC